MIRLEEFLEFFKNTNFPKEQLIRFYRSITKSVVFYFLRKRTLNKLLKLDEEIQWPILKEIDNLNLDIYKTAENRLLVRKFINTICCQKKAKSHSEKAEAIYERISLYPEIFNFSKKDLEHFKIVSQRYEEKLIRARKKGY